MRRSAIVLGAGLIALALTGCATSPHPVSTTTAAGPPPFPRIAGTVVATAQPVTGDWTLTVRVPDAGAAYRAARALLTSHGFQLTSDVPFRDGGSGQACTTALCVSFDALTRPGARPTVEYEVFHSTGMTG